MLAKKIFFCYAHEDEQLLNQLKAHLRPFQRDGYIAEWYDRDISAGAEWQQEIKKQLNNADIVLLLVSPDFMNSDFCYRDEMKPALERQERGEASVIPIILRPVFWQIKSLRKLQALPKNAIPITSWDNRDEAFYDVANNIIKVVREFNGQLPPRLSAILPETSQLEPKKSSSRLVEPNDIIKPPNFVSSREMPIYVPSFKDNAALQKQGILLPRSKRFDKEARKLLRNLIGFILFLILTLVAGIIGGIFWQIPGILLVLFISALLMIIVGYIASFNSGNEE